MKHLWMAVLLAAMPAAAETKKAPAPTLTAAQKTTYTTKLREGRKLVEKKQYAGAIVALQAALVANPGAPAALAEIGWAAYLAKDYVRAEQWTREALASNATPSVIGAAQYNLGLILQAKGDTKGAIAAYAASLDARPNAVVRARLAKLSPDTAKATEPFAPAATTAFKAVADICKDLEPNDADAGCTCSGTKIDLAPATDKAWKAAQLVVAECPMFKDAEKGSRTYYLAVQTAGGWYATSEPTGDSYYNLWCDETAATVAAKQGDKLVIQVAREGSCAGRSETGTDWTITALVAFGIGPSKLPSATSPIQIVHRETESPDLAYDENAKGPTRVVRDVALKPTWDKAGVLHLAGKTKGLDKAEAARLTSPHHFAWK